MPPKPPGPTTKGRFFAALIGLIGGTSLGVYCLSDYQLVKRLPPLEVELNEDGTPKALPFRITLKPTAPLELKPEVKERRRLEEQKYLAKLRLEEEAKQKELADLQRKREEAAKYIENKEKSEQEDEKIVEQINLKISQEMEQNAGKKWWQFW
ncbi:hypothetical protein DASC09_063340 [Saccharomycopsis crataegensis]|uniref:Uncharacterized protein n=1 Tax=Saccharomycopsis crataegensis TaxID=43959 RepID=A0AAV5QVL5_9ASCO|nr:hypothetical protein DASC09_063340 [Saccharomycopsis crataegensis]